MIRSILSLWPLVRRCRDLLQALNSTRESAREERLSLMKKLFGSVGEGTWIQPPFFCDYGFNIHMGKNNFFNFNCVVLDVCEVRMGDFCLFGPAVQIYTAMHPMNAKLRREQEFAKPVVIGSDVWVGGGAIICPGVTLGSRLVIGAGSVVTRDLPDGVFAAGNPCRVIREISAADDAPSADKSLLFGVRNVCLKRIRTKLHDMLTNILGPTCTERLKECLIFREECARSLFKMRQISRHCRHELMSRIL